MSTYVVNSLLSPHLNPLGGRVLPMMAYMGRLRLKGVPFLGQFMYMLKDTGISLVEVYQRGGKSVILVCEKGPKG